MRISDSKYSLALVWAAGATSSFVYQEPAIADLLSIMALGLFFVFGMRIPPGFGVGGFSFCAFIIFTLYKGGRYFRLAPDVDGINIAAYTCVIGIMVQSVFIDSTHWRHLFLLIALV